MDPFLTLNASVTWFLCGLVWTVQTVHYPLFASVGASSFTRYEREHQTRISRVVVPAMLLELALAIALVLRPGSGVAGWAGLLLVVWIWVATAALAVPRHRELQRGFSSAPHRALLRANWHRTVAWSLRSALALWMLVTSEVTP